LPNDECVIRSQVVDGSRQARAVNDGTAAGVLVEALASSAFQGVTLEREVLLGGRNAHVADQHGLAPAIAETWKGMVYRPTIDA
jgi:hypothetical protein